MHDNCANGSGEEEGLLARYLPRLRFDAATERDFRAARNGRSARTNVIAFGVVAVGYDLFLFTDAGLIPDIFAIALWLRLAVMTPLFVLYPIIQHRAMRRDPATRLPGRLAVLFAIAMFGSIMFLQVMTGSHAAAEYFTGAIVVLVGFNNVRYGSFRDQFAGTVAMCIIFAIAIEAADVVASTSRSDAILSLCVCGALTLLGTYRNEYVERMTFQAERREHHLRSQLAERNRELDRLSHTDQLTGIANRRAFDVGLSEGAAAISAVLMIDVDFFKCYNDRYGHGAGDDCLRQVARTLAAVVRSDDLVARYGGEEFAVVLRNMPVMQVQATGERLRAAVDALGLPHAARPDGLGRVTVSIGGKSMGQGGACSVSACVGAADEALYRSKTNGRNTFTLLAA